jgi:hypothetical protein
MNVQLHIRLLDNINILYKETKQFKEKEVLQVLIMQSCFYLGHY